MRCAADYFLNNIIDRRTFVKDCGYCMKGKHCRKRDQALAQGLNVWSH